MKQLTGLTQAQIDAQVIQTKGELVLLVRKQWYHDVGDGIYFKEQRDEVQQGTWLAAVQKMKSDNPYPEGYVQTE